MKNELNAISYVHKAGDGKLTREEFLKAIQKEGLDKFVEIRNSLSGDPYSLIFMEKEDGKFFVARIVEEARLGARFLTEDEEEAYYGALNYMRALASMRRYDLQKKI